MKVLTAKFRQFLDKRSPDARRAINVVIIVIIAISAFLLLFNFVLPTIKGNAQFQSMTTAEIIALLAIIVTIVLASVNFITASLNKRYSSKKQLCLDVRFVDDKIIITSTVENTGSGRITPKSFYLFIDEGIEKTENDVNIYKFPDILIHEGCDFDCALSRECKSNSVRGRLPTSVLGDDFKDTFHTHYRLIHISPQSVMFIDPGESFSEDAIFELPVGVYRVILIGTSEEADCMCAHKIFVVSPPKFQSEVDAQQNKTNKED